ncbi:5-methylcytosine restriction system specificity protein McrC [Segetibacter koreensis]|uniref:5-methylcytosine restriction system specificity protein McrC n=1 Tax=Segetibacter koreensis TaxID=398037 RepID=UPI000365A7EE|nr:hypothetical protein [Segetibacter koreensis]
MQLHKVFEYGAFNGFDRQLLEFYVKEVWNERFTDIDVNDEDLEKKQRILSFVDNTAIAQNYIGFIQTEKDQVEIYPKVFRNYNLTAQNVELFQKHIFFWFDYCRKWRFPITKTSLDRFNHLDFPELIIKLIAERFLDVISQSPISLYEEIEEGVSMPRGTINFSRYLSQRLSTGNNNIIECDLEPLQFDNSLNRAIKYVTRILLNKAKFTETQQKLQEIIFILDEVEDVQCTSWHLSTIKINRFYEDYYELIDICKLVLDQQIYNNQFYQQPQWCLLFPMEYIFEDFIAGFLEKKFNKKWLVEYQKSEMFLTDEKVFQMRHDILLTNKEVKNLKIIVDTKYKLRSAKAREDKKRGISQSDLYQVTSYAFRRGCNCVLLLYPNYSETIQTRDYFSITSPFTKNSEVIKVIAAEVPFWSMKEFNNIARSLENMLSDILSECMRLKSEASFVIGSQL